MGSMSLTVANFKESHPRFKYAVLVSAVPFAADFMTVWSAANSKESEVLQTNERAHTERG
jgi:hypothetical protein